MNPNVIDLRQMLKGVGGRGGDTVKEAIKRAVIYPATILLAVKLRFGTYPQSIRLSDLAPMLSKEVLRYGPRMLVAHNLAKLDGDTIVLNSRSELYDTFIDCAERLSAEQGFGVLRNVRKRFGKG